MSYYDTMWFNKDGTRFMLLLALGPWVMEDQGGITGFKVNLNEKSMGRYSGEVIVGKVITEKAYASGQAGYQWYFPIMRPAFYRALNYQSSYFMSDDGNWLFELQIDQIIQWQGSRQDSTSNTDGKHVRILVYDFTEVDFIKPKKVIASYFLVDFPTGAGAAFINIDSDLDIITFGVTSSTASDAPTTIHGNWNIRSFSLKAV